MSSPKFVMKRALRVGGIYVTTIRSDLTGSDVKSIILDNEGGVFDFPPDGRHQGLNVSSITVTFRKQDGPNVALRITEEASNRGIWEVRIWGSNVSEQEFDRIYSIMEGESSQDVSRREDIYYRYFKELFPGSVGGRRSRRRRFTKGRRHFKRKTTRGRPITLRTRFITRS